MSGFKRFDATMSDDRILRPGQIGFRKEIV
jgi:hypothetical protein